MKRSFAAQLAPSPAHVARLLGVTALFLALWAPPAHACVNATLSEDEIIADLREAEQALDEGDVETARRLAREARERTTTHAVAPPIHLFERALRIEALASVRDPLADSAELEQAAFLLETHVSTHPSPSPAVVADLGEALERVRRDDDALERLVPLADGDLIGSAYAYAALSRAAERRGDDVRATMARERCETMAFSARVCRGEYPRPPLLKGKPHGYAFSGLVFAAAALTQMRRRRQGVALPWMSFRAPLVVAGIGVVAILAFATARHPTLAIMLTSLGLLVLSPAQRRSFLSHVRRGNVPPFKLRAAEPADEALPLVRLIGGPKETETIEFTTESSYRESARRPLLRVGRRPIRLLKVGLTLAFALLLAMVLFGFLWLMPGESPSPVPAIVIQAPIPSSELFEPPAHP